MTPNVELWVHVTGKKIGKLTSVLKCSSFHSLSGKAVHGPCYIGKTKLSTQLTHQTKWFINPMRQMQERERRPRKHRRGEGPSKKTRRVIEWTVCLSVKRRCGCSSSTHLHNATPPIAIAPFPWKDADWSGRIHPERGGRLSRWTCEISESKCQKTRCFTRLVNISNDRFFIELKPSHLQTFAGLISWLKGSHVTRRMFKRCHLS